MSDRFAGTSPNPVARGAELDIKFTNPSLANQTVTITIIDENGMSTTVDIALDAEGSGLEAWKVPAAWGDSAALQHSTSDDHTVSVVDPSPARRKKKPAKKAAKKAGTQRAAKSKSRRR